MHAECESNTRCIRQIQTLARKLGRDALWSAVEEVFRLPAEGGFFLQSAGSESCVMSMFSAYPSRCYGFLEILK